MIATVTAIGLAVTAAVGGQVLVGGLAAIVAGSCIGFLIYNWHPARIFMGDSGSNFLGFTLAALSVLSVAKGTVILALFVSVLALAIPIVDTAWAIVRRRRRGKSIATPDTEHLHHRLLDFGLSPRETVLVFYSGTAIFAAVGLAIYGHKKVLLGAILLLALGIVVILVRRFQRISRG
ncbi:MAG: undecaprenyl/decaprenyl-phosphate alpha-N-acetylglucosaminyl 1-phosphate transferase [Chloroflexi bacterium]|nr:MAG: undecaprenyl/decaprenyl-phosphate alpha-N-acetylglucosaminyl 1-phosphate transferase [Chloroflexota bacterium]